MTSQARDACNIFSNLASEINKGCEKNAKHKTIEVSDESPNPRCMSSSSMAAFWIQSDE